MLGGRTYGRQIDVKTKAITSDKKGHFMVIKGAIQQEDVTLANARAPTEQHLNTYKSRY